MVLSTVASIAYSAASALPLTSGLTAFTLCCGVPAGAFFGRMSRLPNETPREGFIDGARAMLVITTINGASLAVVESIFRAYGIESSFVNNTVIACGAALLAAHVYRSI